MTAETKLDEIDERPCNSTDDIFNTWSELLSFARYAVKLLRKAADPDPEEFENYDVAPLYREIDRFLETGVPKDSP